MQRPREHRFGPAPSIADFDALARQELARLPDELARHCRDVVVQIHDLCDEEVERDMELESPFDLLGLYHGVPIDDKSVSWAHPAPDMVFLYRLPILLAWGESGETLEDLVRNVLIHEIGHHFGLSDDDMERLESEPE